MIKKIFKKLLGKSDKKETVSDSIAKGIQEKSAKFAGFMERKFQQVYEEFFTIKNRLQNLRETNYKLGLKHLENGNLKDAIFRFRFINKFWPDLLDAYYQLAYCLVLDNKPVEAKSVLQKLLNENPDFDPKAFDLLQHIEQGIKSRTNE